MLKFICVTLVAINVSAAWSQGFGPIRINEPIGRISVTNPSHTFHRFLGNSVVHTGPINEEQFYFYAAFVGPIIGGQPITQFTGEVAQDERVSRILEPPIDDSAFVWLSNHKILSKSYAGGATQLLATLPSYDFNGISFSGRSEVSGHLFYSLEESGESSSLFSLPPQGGDPIKLSTERQHSTPSVGSFPDLIQFRLDEVNQRIIYIDNPDAANVFDLFTVPMGGGPSVNITNGSSTAMHFFYGERVIAADGSKVFYSAQGCWNCYMELENGLPVSAEPIKFIGSALDDSEFYRRKFSPNGEYLLFDNDEQNSGARGIYALQISGNQAPAPVKITPDITDNQTIFNRTGPGDADYLINSSNTHVVYLLHDSVARITDLYSVPIIGGVPIKLNGQLVAGGNVSVKFDISADGNTVVYRADQDTDGVLELYSVPITGGAPRKLSKSTTGTEDVIDFKISPDNSRVIYRSDQNFNNRTELYSNLIAGGEPKRISGQLQDNSRDVETFHINPDSSSVIYSANQDVINRIDLYSVSIDGGPLSAGVIGDVDQDEFCFSVKIKNNNLVHLCI